MNSRNLSFRSGDLLESHRLKPGIRVLLGGATAIGPGKAALLEGIRETGSIAAAARSMRISYRRAWGLVTSMNACFREPLVVVTKGGSKHGGATLTETGGSVLAIYRSMEAEAAEALASQLQTLRALMSDTPD